MEELLGEIAECKAGLASEGHEPEIYAHLRWQIGRKQTELDALQGTLVRMKNVEHLYVKEDKS